MNPDGLAALARADDYEQVKNVAEYYAEYAALFDGSGNNPGDKTLEDKFFEHEVISFFINFLMIHMTTFVFSFCILGEIERFRIYSTIPLWRFLFVLKVEGAGMP